MGFVLRNLMEDIVIQSLDKIIDQLNVCKCDKCRLDIASYTLNRHPSKYVATTQDELISKLDALNSDFKASIITTIVSGANIVKNQPRHSKEDIIS